MRILGIDPGLRVCGYAAIEIDGGDEKLLEAGVFRTDNKEPIEKRLNSISLALCSSENSDIDGTRQRCYTAKLC
ncbi:MAG: crossover junction endodeoxyribonuclease RuvC [Planctomycetota bacterium]